MAGPALAQNAARITPRPAATAPASFAKTVVRTDLASAAVRLEAALKTEAGNPARPAAQSRSAGQTQLAAGKPDQALTALTAAVAADPADPRNWQAYARAASAASETRPENDYQGRARLRERATAAAYRAYELAGTAADAAASLALLGAAEGGQESWRPALDAYAASLALDEDEVVREAYDSLRAEHGFRIIVYKVDSDAAAPRACFTLS